MPRYLHEAELERRERIARLDAEEVEAERQAAAKQEHANRLRLTEYDPSKPSRSELYFHPEADQ